MAGSSFAACGDLTHKQNTLLSFSQAECFRPLEIFHSCENDACLGKDKFLVWCSQHLQHWLMYTLGVFSIRPVVSINKGGCALLPFTENSAFHHCPAACTLHLCHDYLYQAPMLHTTVSYISAQSGMHIWFFVLFLAPC